MYKIETLPNNLRIITREESTRESTSIGFWVGVGGRYECDRLKGAAHFLEHIVFKGSQEYACEEIKQSIEGVGGSLNAFTSEEQTCFYAKVPAKHLNSTFDVLADMVFFPKITKKDVQSEKTVIVEEIKMYHDLPQYHVMELLDGLLFPGHPLGKSLAGSAQTVLAMTHKDLKEFHSHYYHTDNIVISVCGNVSHDKIVRLIKKKLSKLQSTQGQPLQLFDEAQKKPRTHYEHRAIEQMHVALGMPAYDENDPKRYVMGLINVILGANMSSRLFVEVREKRGLAYSISSSPKSLHDVGSFMVRAGVDSTKIVDAVSVILKELNKLTKALVSEDE
ncbi:MAG: putative Zn-dependent peptidase, partial [Lysobacterales bacterium]